MLESIEPEALFPLPEAHWINQSLEDVEEGELKTLLTYAIFEVEDAQFCR